MTFGDILANISGFFTLKRTQPQAVTVLEPKRSSRNAVAKVQGATQTVVHDFRSAYPPATTMVKPTTALAMDAMGVNGLNDVYQWTQDAYIEEGLGFLGYAYLAQLTQRSEYRLITEIRAEEMTRKWIELQYTGEESNDEKLAELYKAMTEFKVREVFRKAIEVDGQFGRAQIYLDTGAGDLPDELNKPLPIDKAKVGKGQFKGIRVVEPIWTYALDYDSGNPLSPDFYKPRTWTVMSRIVHSDRLLTIVSKPVPDILKPAYAFGGVSLIQMAKPYVDNWIRTRQSVSDLIHKFSVMILQTDLNVMLADRDGEGLVDRLDLYATLLDNSGIFAVNKDTEDMKNIAVPMSGLDKLQAQAQEQMASVSRTPLVKLLGVTPGGLNTSTDGEIQVYYDSIHAGQEKIMTEPLTIVIKLLQLHIWGEIDPNITFAFVPLWQMSEREAADVRKLDADADVELVNSGIIAPEEARKRLASDPESAYAGLDVDDVPERPEEESSPEHEDNQDEN